MNFKINLLVLILFCTIIKIWSYQSQYPGTNQIRVGAFFEPQHEAMSLAFQNAVTDVTLHTESSRTPIVYDMEFLTPDKSFEAQNKLCSQMKRRSGIAAVFGRASETPQSHMKLLCSTTQIPFIETSWVRGDSRAKFAINLYPVNEELIKAFADIVKFWDWKTFTVIYEEGNGLIRLQKVLEIPGGDEYKMTIRQLELSQDEHEELENMLVDMKEKKEYRIIIDCHVSKIPLFLEKADSMGMLSGYYHFHFTTLDLTQIDFEPYIYKGANITSMRLIDPSNLKLKSLTSEWVNKEVSYGRSPLLGSRFIGTESALMYDAVHILAYALRNLSRSRPISTESLNCHKREKWANGTDLLNHLKTSVHNGLSGEITLEDGLRKEFRLGIISVTAHGLTEIGSWNTKSGINITTYSEVQKVLDDRERLRNTTLRVVTVYDPPYVMKLSEPNEHGREHEGFIIDLLDELSAILGFNYTIYEQEDRQYGSEIAPGKWNGMIGDLMTRDSSKKADIAAAGLSITYARARVVDFSMPFLNLGITIIYKKPVISPPDLFSFLLPLSPDVWIYMVAAYLCVSFMMFIIARFSPYEWENPHPCNSESEEVENEFSILNCMWFAIGSLMQQGSDIAPKASSTRCVASIWYLFTLIIVSSYTANLAAFLTKSRMDVQINNAEDLSLQSEIKYGTLTSGSTRDFFKNAKMPVYKRMESFMTANMDNVFVESNTEGFEKVKASNNYAFLSESTSIDYQVQRNCDLMQVGDLLDSKGYGLAAPKDSPWMRYISKEIVNLQQQQVLAKKYKKWWVEKSNTVCKDDDADDQQTSALGVGNLGGVFLVLAGGSIFALLVSILEFLWKAGKTSRKQRVSFLTEVRNGLYFIFVKCTSSRNMGDENSTEEESEVNKNDLQGVPNLNKDKFI